MVIESNKNKNNLILIVFLIIGIIFLFLTSQIENPNRNQQAAFYLGLLLSSLSGLALINQDQRKIEVDSNTRRVIYRRKSLFGGDEVRFIPFQQIKKVAVARVGRRGPVPTQSYFINIQLVHGQTIYTGYSSFDEYETKELAAEMANTIGCEHSPIPVAPLEGEIIENAIFAMILAALSWALYYRATVGPWCQAMWFGSAPALFLVTTFWASYGLIMLIRHKFKT